MRQPLRLTLSALALLALAPAVLSLSLRDASEPLSLRDAASSAAQAGVPAATGLSSLTRDKWIGLALAISSSLAIGTSFIITKKVRSRAAERGATRAMHRCMCSSGERVPIGAGASLHVQQVADTPLSGRLLEASRLLQSLPHEVCWL